MQTRSTKHKVITRLGAGAVGAAMILSMATSAFAQPPARQQELRALRNECKKGGYVEFGFRNQGQCIKFVNLGGDLETRTGGGI